MADDEYLEVDVNGLTLDEMERIEDLTGKELHSFLDGDEVKISAKFLKALALISKQRENPDATMADVGPVRFDRVRIVGAEATPTSAAG